MEYRSLGRTGAQVSALCLGCMNFGGRLQRADSIALMHRALSDGINFWDTADVYSRGISETIVGKALVGKRDEVFLATKAFNKMGDGPNDWGSTRYHLISACEASLKRLGTDHIDLYQLHRPHPAVPIDETLRAMDDLVTSGKVRYVGTSTFAAWQVVESLWASKELGLNRVVCEQPPYNLLDRRIERELLPMCRTYGLATIPWAPLAGGILTGKYRVGAARPESARYATRAVPFAPRQTTRRWRRSARTATGATHAASTQRRWRSPGSCSSPASPVPSSGRRTPCSTKPISKPSNSLSPTTTELPSTRSSRPARTFRSTTKPTSAPTPAGSKRLCYNSP